MLPTPPRLNASCPPGGPPWRLAVALTLDHADPSVVSLFEKLHGLKDLDESGVDELRDAITSSGALERVEGMIQDLTTSARAALQSTTTLTDEGVAALDALIDVSTARSA